MALFKKKEKKGENSDIPKLPEIPQLPQLPEFPGIGEKDFVKEMPEMPEQLPQLPSFPNGSLGNKFSQDTIKEAIAGKKGVGVEAEVFSEELPMMQRPLRIEGTKRDFSAPLQRTRTREAEPSDFANARKRFDSNEREFSRMPEKFNAMSGSSSRGQEPIFIRIDKFEEGSRTFEEVRRKISEIENMVEDVKKVREKEEQELALWESEIKQIKEKIEKIDSNIFSQVE
ncbi:MAG: hypothetical protein PHQ66_01095 [Candidatus Nanoarchaeia archaeon]|nr:hypothetical protein [Candidatus Nanoarchaeia archaeon]MDD5358025.1 hypothetical protein [Candidatus Nanoarchaeia archaeon]MDD5588944.1 hypothetical protein [Candidatus Nanoarchaeia archaeon]